MHVSTYKTMYDVRLSKNENEAHVRALHAGNLSPQLLLLHSVIIIRNIFLLKLANTHRYSFVISQQPLPQDPLLMNRDYQGFNPTFNELGPDSAARTASLAADSMVTYMGGYDKHSTNSIANDLVLSSNTAETYPEDDDFHLSRDIDALFFAAGSSGSSNDGGSDKLSLMGDEDENTGSIKSGGGGGAAAVPTGATSTGSTGDSTSVLPPYNNTASLRAMRGRQQHQAQGNLIPQYVGPSTTKTTQAQTNQRLAHPIPITQQLLMPFGHSHSTGIIPSAVQSSSALGQIPSNKLASQPWITFGPTVPLPLAVVNPTNHDIDESILSSTIHLSTAKLSSSQNKNPTLSNTKSTRKRERNSSSSAIQDPTPSMGVFITGSTGSSTCSLDQNFIPENEIESKQRRKDRNLREQMRSQKITHQIADLKDLLVASNVPCKPDKFSTLNSVYQYIKDLHDKKVQLDEELRYLVQTINQTNNAVHASQGLHGHNSTILDSSSSTSSTMNPDLVTSSPTTTCHQDHGLSTPEVVDYQSIFTHANVPLAVVRLDGKLMDCNIAFTTLFSMTREDLGLPSSLSSSNQHVDINTNNSNKKNNSTHAATSTTTTNTTTNRMSLFHVLAPYNMNPLFVAMSSMLENAAKEYHISSSSSLSSSICPPPTVPSTSLPLASTSTVVTSDTSTTVESTFEIGSDYWSGILYPHDSSKIPVCLFHFFVLIFLLVFDWTYSYVHPMFFPLLFCSL